MLGWEIANNKIKVRVNSIAPGVFPSEMTAGDSGDNQKSELPKEDFEGKVPAGRPGNDRDMGSAMLFVATNQYVNGQVSFFPSFVFFLFYPFVLVYVFHLGDCIVCFVEPAKEHHFSSSVFFFHAPPSLSLLTYFFSLPIEQLRDR